ncbi:phosphatase PAP2 family protein [Paenibacillus sp. ACRRX]|uniref:phosphatase PAP2 family protein n=1 Tax=unclassified Paenibacillus TaxID=185978 RepID=UPI001EF3E994|nr:MULTISPECIES: phosphatase PAP2 family protein [unclassified Paenibacillus]MCG7409921.1 phosphatase PAP2 family protein [Paenibacillus sp. ACRRX]MDK8183013.1 phosphatase PAP2 family protein [Paenibacillus sp. UMB4589-SE434]
MTRVIAWLGHRERQLFFWINHRLHHRFLNIILYTLTHLGGATFTITFSVLLALFAPHPWDTVGWQCLVALTVSHIPVALIKKIYPRIRPHLALPNIRTFKKPLIDHSFPSGHTTAIFSIVVPCIMMVPMLAWLLLPITGIVALSRMYLGLHYPSDCLVGALLGTSAAVGTVMLWQG